MLISLTSSFMFIANLKSASTAIESHLRPLADVALVESKFGKHSTLAEVQGWLPSLIGQDRWNKLFIFGVIRDPIDYVISLYNSHTDKRFADNPSLYTKHLDFEEFLHLWVARNGGQIRSQYTRFLNQEGHLAVSFLISYSRLWQGLQKVTEIIGIEIPTPLPIINSSARMLHRSALTEAQIAWIEHYFHGDRLVLEKYCNRVLDRHPIIGMDDLFWRDPTAEENFGVTHRCARKVLAETTPGDENPMKSMAATPDDVKAAYRLVLQREPDPVGFAHYCAFVEENPTGPRQLLELILASQEAMDTEDQFMAVDIGGVFVVVDPTEPEFGRQIAKSRTWEPHIIAVVRDNLNTGDVFVDVGANVGVMSFAAAQVVGQCGKVIAFEPNEKNAAHFLRGVLVNGFQQSVSLHRLALSDKTDLLNVEGGSNSHLVRSDRRARLVQSVPGDAILGNEPAIHLIKIDVEGHEPYVMRGLKHMISRHSPLILCEFNPRCLIAHGNTQPTDFATDIFGMTHAITVIEYDGASNTISHPGELIAMWREKNHAAAASGRLPAGMVHFDLLFRAAP